MLSEELQVKLLELWKLGWLDPPCAVKQLNCLPFFPSYLHFLTFPPHVWVVFKHYPLLHLTRHSNLICILLKYHLLGYFELGSGSLGHLASQALRSRIKDETKKIKMCVYFPVQHLRSYIVLCRHDVRSPHLNLSTIASSIFSKMSNYPFKSDTYLIHSWKISEFPEFKAVFLSSDSLRRFFFQTCNKRCIQRRYVYMYQALHINATEFYEWKDKHTSRFSG